MRERLVLLAAAVAAFGASLASGFHFDDFSIFSDWPDFWSLRQTRPLTYLTFWLNYQAGGRNPVGYHAANLALHVAAVLLAFEVLRRVIPKRAALIAAAIFAVHPLQAEAVDYVWGRSIVLATVFCLLALLAWMDERPWVAVAWFAAALLAKEEVAAFPLALIAMHWADKKWKPIAAMLALSLAAGLRVIYATAVTPGAPAGLQAGISPVRCFLAQGEALWRYLQLMIVPVGFTVDPAISIPAPWLGLLLWAGIGVLVWAGGRWALAGFLLLLPSSSIFPAADLAADRRMYLPLLFFAAGAALLLDRVKFRAVVPVVFAAFAIGRTYIWMSDERLWREAMERAPEKVRPKIQLSRNLPSADALPLLADARRLAPDDPAIPAETGKVLMAAGEPVRALAEFGRALALNPRDAGNYNNRGAALAALGQNDAARQDFRRALELDPGLVSARQNLESIGRR